MAEITSRSPDRVMCCCWCPTGSAAGSSLRTVKPVLNPEGERGVWRKRAELSKEEGETFFVASVNPDCR